MAKMPEKYNTEAEQQARQWIESVLGEKLVPGADPNQPLGPDEMNKVLKDGVILCRLLEAVTGKKVAHDTSESVYKQMENITDFLTGAESYGVYRGDLFQTLDLFDNQNMAAVIGAINALKWKFASESARTEKLHEVNTLTREEKRNKAVTRSGNTDWCKCGFCQQSEWPSKCQCCAECPETIDIMGKGTVPCITLHPMFDTTVLVPMEFKQEAMKRSVVRSLKRPDRRFRFKAYQEFVRLVHGVPKKKAPTHMPSCVVDRIRQKFPLELTEEYTFDLEGFPA